MFGHERGASAEEAKLAFCAPNFSLQAQGSAVSGTTEIEMRVHTGRHFAPRLLQNLSS